VRKQEKAELAFCTGGVASAAAVVLGLSALAGVAIAGVVAQRRRARLIRFINDSA